MNHELAAKDMLSNAQNYGETLIKEFKERKTGEGWIFKEDGTVIPPADK